MRTLRAGAILIALSMSPLLSTPAHAGADAVAAEALFEQGRKAMESEEYETACARFAESQRLEPAAGTLMNLAVCEEKLGRLASAWQHWREALDALPKVDDRRGFAQGRLEALEPRLPYLTLLPPRGAAGGFEVLRDGVKLGSASLGLELPVDPGRHEIVLRAGNREDFRVEVELEERERKTVELALGKERPSGVTRPSGAPSAAARDPGPARRRAAGIAVGGVGLIGLGGAIATGLMVADRQRTVEDNCDARKVCNDTGIDAARSGQTLLVLNTVAWGIGVVGLGVGSVLVATSAGRRRPSATRASAEVAFSVSPHPGGATLEVRTVLP